MAKAKIALLTLLALTACSLLAFTLYEIVIASSTHTTTAITLKTSPQFVIGDNASFRGDANAKYTLVEFGDYQCPPCKAIRLNLSYVLIKYKEKLRFVFRHFPLEQIHPQAKDAALFAIAMEKRGVFWKAHDALYSVDGPPDRDQLSKIAKELGFDPGDMAKEAESFCINRLDADLAAVHKLNLNGTPSFCLCCPDGRVLLLGSLKNIDAYLK